MFYTWELFVPYLGIIRYWPSLVNGAVIPTSDPCTSHVVSKHLVIVSRSETENREPGERRHAAGETHNFEVNRQPVVESRPRPAQIDLASLVNGPPPGDCKAKGLRPTDNAPRSREV